MHSYERNTQVQPDKQQWLPILLHMVTSLEKVSLLPFPMLHTHSFEHLFEPTAIHIHRNVCICVCVRKFVYFLGLHRVEYYISSLFFDFHFGFAYHFISSWVSVKVGGTRFLACIFRFGELCVIHLLHYLTLNCFDTAIVEFYMMSVHTIELNGYRTIHTNILSISGNFNCLRFSFGSFVYTLSSHAPFFSISYFHGTCYMPLRYIRIEIMPVSIQNFDYSRL